MNTRHFIGLSLALNVALAATIYFSMRKPHESVPAPATELSAPRTAEPSSPAADRPPPPGLPFHWSQLASADLKIYRDRLRAIGCPELTVREIIRAVINERFVARRRNLLAPLEDRYWDMVLNGELARRQAIPQSEWGQALTALAAERQRLITEVLGPDALAAEVEQQTRRAALEQKRSWLPADKREQLIELEQKYQQRLTEWAANLSLQPDGLSAAEGGNNLQKWQQELDEAEKQLLTPEELDELHLRESDAADWAGNLPGFNPSEDEWRAMTRLRSELDDGQSRVGPELSDEERTARQDELQANFEQGLKDTLGPERFAQYELANNGEFQGVRNITQRYGLPDGVAASAFDIQQTAQEQAREVASDLNLSPEARQAALLAIRQETERSLGEVLNPRAFSTYKEYHGDWLKEMAPTD